MISPIGDNDESQPLLQTIIPIRSNNEASVNNKPLSASLEQEMEEGGQTDEEEEEDNVGTYYHHPERRSSRNLSRSYGATSQTNK